MTTFFGIACLVLGIMWIAFPALASFLKTIKTSDTSSIGSPSGSEERIVLFDAYLMLHDHLEAVGTPEQKKALEVVLGAVVIQVPKGNMIA